MSPPSTIPWLPLPLQELEYEDEYDDSFDDLLQYGGEGETEAEGNVGRAEHGSAAAGGAARGGPQGAAAVQGEMQRLSMQDRQQQQQRQPLPLQAPQGGRGRGRGGGHAKGRLWVLEGRIYNYAKQGAMEVGSHEEAHAVLAAAEQATHEIHGLGPGGNAPMPGRRQRWQQEEAEEEAGEGSEQRAAPVHPSHGGGRGGRGGGREGGGGTREGGRGYRSGEWLSHRHKDERKAAIGNHHRKDRATQKMSRGML